MSCTKTTRDELLIAIHKHCLECQGGSRKLVKNCGIRRCNLYPYRQEPTRIREKPVKGQVTLFDMMKKEA